MNRIKIEIPPEFDVKENDYNNKIEKEMKFNNSYNGSINFKKIPITYLNNDCKLLAFLNNYLRHNKLEKNDYNIYYKKGLEWFSYLYLYKKM